MRYIKAIWVKLLDASIGADFSLIFQTSSLRGGWLPRLSDYERSKGGNLDRNDSEHTDSTGLVCLDNA